MQKNLIASKLRVGVLAILSALGVATTSCGDSKGAENSEKACQEKAKEAHKEVAAKLTAEKNAYFNHSFDSIHEANGAKKLDEELHALPCYWEYENEIKTIEYSKTLGGVMEKELREAVFGMVVDYMLQVNNLLEQHGLPRFYTGNVYMVINGLLEDIVNAEYAKAELVDVPNHRESLDNIGKGSDLSQEEINKIIAQAKKMDDDVKKKVAAIKKAVEKRYADYYVTENPNSLGFDSLGEGSWSFGYQNLNDYNYDNPEVLITRKSINVYDQNLDENFFNEEGASYKLIDLGNHKWQVEKKRKNGTTVKTKVFQDNKEYEELYGHKTREEAKDVAVGQESFRFEPGAHKGGRIYYSKVVKIQKRKDWKPEEFSDAEKKEIDSLNNEIARKKQMEQERDSLNNVARNRAIELVKKRYGSYEH